MKNIIFLPGAGCSQRLFSHQTQSLASHFKTKVIVCNASDTMSGHIQYVLNQSPQEFILIGHSFGGWIAQWIAIHAPERVLKLILMGTGTGEVTKNLKATFEEMLSCFEKNEAHLHFDKLRPLIVYEERRNDSELLDLIKAMENDFSREGLINQAKTNLEGKDTINDLHKIQCQTLLIHGKQDAFSEKDMRFLREKIPNNHYVEIDKCGHMLPIEKPEMVSDLITQFIA